MAASNSYDMLNSLNTSRDDWKIKVKVMTLWSQSYRDSPSIPSSLEMILIDEQGNKIQGSIMRYLVSDFRDIIKEAEFFEITNFGLTPNKGNYLLVRHEWKITFRRLTRARRCGSFVIDKEGYEPVSFDDVLQWNLSTLYAFDVIGHLVSMEELRITQEKGRESKSIEFILEDLSGKRISCALWGDHAVILMDGVAKNKISDQIIVLINNAKLKDWKGNPQVSNQLFGSRVHVNAELHTIEEYRKRLSNRDDDQIPLSFIEEYTPRTVVKREIQYYVDTPVRTVDFVRSYMEINEFVVKAAILNVVLDEGWFTFSCKQCSRRAQKVEGDAKDVKMYDCVQCGPIDEAIGKVRTVLRVEDSSGALSVVLFDRQLSKLINRSVAWLNKRIQNAKNPSEVPPEIKSLVGLELIWKISVSQINIQFQYPAYTVSRVTDDEEVYEHVKLKLMEIGNDGGELHENVDTPDGKVFKELNLDDTPQSSVSKVSPVPFSLKRKSESPSSDEISAQYKSRMKTGMSGVKIGSMDEL